MLKLPQKQWRPLISGKPSVIINFGDSGGMAKGGLKSHARSEPEAAVPGMCSQRVGHRAHGCLPSRSCILCFFKNNIFGSCHLCKDTCA